MTKKDTCSYDEIKIMNERQEKGKPSAIAGELHLNQASNSKSSSVGTYQADHADQAGQVQIKRDKCRSSGSYRRKPDQTDQIIYYNL